MSIPFIDQYIQLIRHNPNYRRLWFSAVISQTGDWFNLIASAALVAKLSGSGLAVGGLFLARLLPPVLLGPLVGVVADRFDRRKIMMASDLLRAVIVLGFLFIQTEEQVWLLYVLTVAQLSLGAFFEPAHASLMPSLVRREELITANALDATTWSTMLSIGAALGGVATALLGIPAAFILDSLSFILSAWFISQVRPPAGPAEGGHEEAKTSGWQTLIAGWRYLGQQRRVLVVALIKGSQALAYGGMAVVEVAFAKEIFPIGVDGSGTLGLIYFVIGLSTGIGPLIARRLTGENQRAMYWTILFCYGGMILGFVMVGFTGTLPFLLLATFVRTLGTGISWVYSSTLLQLNVPNKFLGRVFAFDMAAMTLAASVSTVWAGWGRDGLGLTPQHTALMLATVPVVMGLGWAIYLIGYFKPQKTLATQPEAIN
jgi:MFS family permease